MSFLQDLNTCLKYIPTVWKTGPTMLSGAVYERSKVLVHSLQEIAQHFRARNLVWKV